MDFTEDLLLRTDDRLAPSPITLSGDDRFGETLVLSRDHSWSLPFTAVDELRKLGEWLVTLAAKIQADTEEVTQ